MIYFMCFATNSKSRYCKGGWKPASSTSNYNVKHLIFNKLGAFFIAFWGCFGAFFVSFFIS